MEQVTHLGIVVEGHGEVYAAPVLVRRVVDLVAPGHPVRVGRPIRIPKTRLVKRPGELERAVRLAAGAARAGDRACVLVMLDADDDCPACLAPELLGRAKRALAGDAVVAVVIAKKEFESWLLAAVDSLRGHRGISEDAEPPADPEEVRGAKEWLSSIMGGSYRPTVDQAALVAQVDLVRARERSPSLDKLVRAVAFLLSHRG